MFFSSMIINSNAVWRYFIVILYLLFCSCEGKVATQSFSNPIAATSFRVADSVTWLYDASYYRIAYPNGDVPKGGVCTDVVIRILRMNGIDLQKDVHDDMMENFDDYPKIWGLSSPDANIDHRRVPNLMTYFRRKGYEITNRQFQPGDIVCWNLLGGINHIGIFLEDETVFHNMGPASHIEKNFLFRYPIIGHYRIPIFAY